MPTKTIPARAFALRAGRFEFADPPAEKTATGRGRIKLTASSGQVFNARWWGPLVFDYSGMTWAKDRLALDYCHDPEEILGYADQIDASGGNLTVAGELISVSEGDRAAQVLALGQAGVPWEASIAFDPYNQLVVEEWQPGTTAEVNGRQIPGPVTVIRQCLLRGVAVCPHGADPYTESEFAGDAAGDVQLTVITHAKEPHMADQETKPVETGTPPPPDPRAELQAQLADYATRFGAEQGAAWVAAGKPLLECYAEFVAQQKAAHDAAIAKLTADRDALQAAVTELQSRLDSLSLGEAKPASGKPAEGEAVSARQQELTVHLKPGLARFAAGMKLPTAKK
jgi:hypothetical protein